MSSHADRIPQEPPMDPDPEFDPDAALRETYAQNLRPEERGQLAALCETVLMLTREAPVIVDRIHGGGMVGALRATGAELRHLAGYLDFTGEWDGKEISRAEARLGYAAEALGVRVGEIADELDAAIAVAVAAGS